MALIKCPDCQKEVSSESPQCVHCGRPIVKTKSASATAQYSTLGALLLIIGMVKIMWNAMSYGVYGFQDAWGWTFVIIGIAIMRFKNMAKVILCGGLLLLIIAVFSVNDTPHTLSGGTASTPAPAIKPSDPDEFRVPSDPKAIYKLVLVKPTQGVLLVVSARKGPSGKSLAAREMHCKQKKFRYVGEGDDLQQLLKNIRDTDPMSPLVEGSISWHIAQRACKKAV